MKRRKYRQGYNAKLDESLGMKHRGRRKQSMGSRRHESEGMEKSRGGHEFMGDSSMDAEYHHHMAHAHHKYMANKHRKHIHRRK